MRPIDFVIMLFICFFVMSGLTIFKMYLNNHKAKKLVEDAKNYVKDFSMMISDMLLNINKRDAQILEKLNIRAKDIK